MSFLQYCTAFVIFFVMPVVVIGVIGDAVVKCFESMKKPPPPIIGLKECEQQHAENLAKRAEEAYAKIFARILYEVERYGRAQVSTDGICEADKDLRTCVEALVKKRGQFDMKVIRGDVYYTWGSSETSCDLAMQLLGCDEKEQ